MSSKFGKLRMGLAALALLGAGSAVGQTLSASDPTVQANATNEVVNFNYAPGGNVSIVIFNTSLTNAANVVQGNTFQYFDSVNNAFQDCAGVNRFIIAGTVRVLCTADGRYTLQTLDPDTDPLPAVNNLLRARFNVNAAATAGQTATFAFAPNCGAGEAPNMNFCTEFTTTAAARTAGTVTDTGVVTVAAGPQGPTISPPAQTTASVAAGTEGFATQAQFQFTAAGGDAGQSSTLTCGAPTGTVTLVSGGNQTVNTGAQPAPIVVSVVLTAAAQNPAGTITCNGTLLTVNAPAGGAATGPTVTAPATTTVTVSGANVGQQGTVGIQFAAAGGTPGQSTPLVCGAPTGTVVLVSGGNQTVNTGTQPAPIVVGVPLTIAAQTPAGTITCNGTLFTINAPAGSTFTPPSVIPASSLWSQLMLIALFAALGGVVLVLRRNG